MDVGSEIKANASKFAGAGADKRLLAALYSIYALLQWSLIAAPLAWAPGPVDNPLKGLVPYQGQGGTNFPCSMEFNYLPINAVAIGPDRYDWAPLENLLNDVATRGRQTVFRFYADYPGKRCAVPQYLIEQGLKVTEWHSDNTYSARCYTPDDSDSRFAACLTNFVLALGRKYDGDPRIGFITAGLLGSWGEWHNWPRNDLWASKQIQQEVLEAYVRGFKKTRVLLRYPAGQNDPVYCPNAQLPFGYHDDSFAFATASDSGKGNEWFFVNLLANAGVLEKWKSQPIGGEVRPEVWGCCFDEPGCEPKGQDFATCIEQTHVTWLMDSGAFTKPLTPGRATKAMNLARRMGYEFSVSDAEIIATTNHAVKLRLKIENRGTAPFYYDWPVETAVLDAGGKLAAIAKLDWKITAIASGSSVNWEFAGLHGLTPGRYKLLLRIVNPLEGGRPLCFANATQNADKAGWLTLGSVDIGM